jgi:hypothetical protein
MTLVLEAGVLAFVWHPRLRRFWLGGIMGMHLGIALLLGLWTFAAIMIVFDVAAFGWRGSGGQVAADAIKAAKSGDTIRFEPSLNGQDNQADQ